MGPMGELGALFNPGMRHEIEERRSKASRREEEGQGDPGDLRIDLLSGVAVINMGESWPVDDEANADAADDNAASDSPADTGTTETGTAETGTAETGTDGR